MKHFNFGSRVVLFLALPLVIGGLWAVLLWGEISDIAQFVSFGVLLIGLITIGVLDLKMVEWVGRKQWFALAVIGTHLIASAVFVFGGFLPFLLGIADLELADVQEIAFECCWTNADEDFGAVFQEYFGLTAILAVFCAPVSAAVWWASQTLPFGRQP